MSKYMITTKKDEMEGRIEEEFKTPKDEIEKQGNIVTGSK